MHELNCKELILFQPTKPNVADYYCYYCGADSADLLELSEAEMEDFDAQHPEVDRSLLYEGRCPCCGFPYESEEDEFEI